MYWIHYVDFKESEYKYFLFNINHDYSYFKDLKTVESVIFPECIHIKINASWNKCKFSPKHALAKNKNNFTSINNFEIIVYFCNEHTLDLQLFSVMNVSLIYLYSDIHGNNEDKRTQSILVWIQ